MGGCAAKEEGWGEAVKVWIIERDHQPIMVPCDTPEGMAAARRNLNKFPTNDGHYYDAVLYERLEPEPEVQNLESA
jgi:hypothetical protein